MRKKVLAAISLLGLTSVAFAVKNVIYFISDGMGFNHLYLASLLEGKTLNIMKIPYTGIVKTFSANTWVTDSAAAGTALATGFKTNNGMIGMLPNEESVPTIMEICQSIRNENRHSCHMSNYTRRSSIILWTCYR